MIKKLLSKIKSKGNIELPDYKFKLISYNEMPKAAKRILENMENDIEITLENIKGVIEKLKENNGKIRCIIYDHPQLISDKICSLTKTKETKTDNNLIQKYEDTVDYD